MKTLVTGAAGRIGSQLIDALLANGHEVCGLDLRLTARLGTDYREITGSLQDPDVVKSAVDGADVVFHLGALMSWALEDKAEMFESNVEGTRILLEVAAASGVLRFIFASSGEVYPENAPAFLPITEDHPLNANSPYGLTKLLGEELVRFHQRTGIMETVILRFSHTQDAAELLDEASFFSGPRFFLGPRIRQQEALGNLANVDILRAQDPGEPAHVLSRNETGRPFQMHITDTRDMVAGLMLALDHPAAAGGTFNLGATDPIGFAPLLEKMSSITGYPVIPVDFPGAGVYYNTSNKLICNTLGYKPEWTIERMLTEAAKVWEARKMG